MNTKEMDKLITHFNTYFEQGGSRYPSSNYYESAYRYFEIRTDRKVSFLETGNDGRK